MIEFKALGLQDCNRISDIDASQYVGKAWREVDGRLQLVEIFYFDPSWPNGYDTHLKHLVETVVGNGLAVGAFDHRQKMMGFIAVNRAFFGKTARYVLLDQLFITREARGMGLGRALFAAAADAAKTWGAEKFYICAGSAEETIAFYRALGCKEAVEVNTELFDGDPRDMQLEFAL